MSVQWIVGPRKLVFALCTALSGLLALPSAHGAESSRPPNVVLIVTDDQGWGDMSNMKHPYLKTPCMDLLKKESVSFPNFLVAPLCAPTRAGLMTGRYHYRTGVFDTYQSRVNMWSDEKTLPEYLKAGGYTTGFFGKWHLGYNYPLRPKDQGFDTYVTWEESQSSRMRPLIVEDGRSYYEERFLSDVFCDKVTAFIKKNSQRPFFAYYPLYLPHTHPDNLEIPVRYTERFRKQSNLVDKVPNIYGMIEKADELVGRVLKTIDESGLRENTVVIFLSDNGPTLIRYQDGTVDKNGGLRGNKGSVYEGGLRVPFFVRWPGHFSASTEVKAMANYTDVLPTVLDICGLTPSRWEKPIDGKSVLPLLKNPGGAKWGERTFFMHQNRPSTKENLKAKMWVNSCVRGERYKLVNGQELYDLTNDPSESKNLASQIPDQVRIMRAQYERWFADTTGERNFESAPNVVGEASNPVTFLYYFEKNFDAQPSGWPVEVFSEGPYTVCVENVNYGMIGNGVRGRIRCGGVTIEKEVDNAQSDLVFENISLPGGRHIFQFDWVGDVKPMIGRYNLPDLGHRTIWIRKD